MPQPIDLYWSFRSPYSYLATKRICEIQKTRDVAINVKIVLPLAVRDPNFFQGHGPEWMQYTIRDVLRLAQMNRQTMMFPNPDPIVTDPETGTFAKEQPHIWNLSRLGIAAAEAGHGLEFIDRIGALIWSGQPWTDESVFSAALDGTNINLSSLKTAISQDIQRHDDILAKHDMELRAAGHWGVPTLVLNGEPFFGGDRLDVLLWRLDQAGVN